MDLNDTPEPGEHRRRVRRWLAEHAGEAPPLGEIAVAFLAPGFSTPFRAAA